MFLDIAFSSHQDLGAGRETAPPYCLEPVGHQPAWLLSVVQTTTLVLPGVAFGQSGECFQHHPQPVDVSG